MNTNGRFDGTEALFGEGLGARRGSAEVVVEEYCSQVVVAPMETRTRTDDDL